MNNQLDFANLYYNWLRDNTATHKLANGWTEIATPFLDRHNDGLIIYVKKDGDKITLSDDGYILNDLSSDGVSLKGKAKQRILNEFLNSYGVENNSGELTILATLDNFALKKHMFMQAMLAVNDMFLLNSDTVKSIFLEDVSSFFDKHNLLNTPNVTVRGKSGLDYKIDFIIPASKKNNKSEKIIKAINSPRTDFIQRTLFLWEDIKKVRNNDTQLVVFLNDKKTFDNKLVTVLNTYNAMPILWSKRDSYINELSVA